MHEQLSGTVYDKVWGRGMQLTLEKIDKIVQRDLEHDIWMSVWEPVNIQSVSGAVAASINVTGNTERNI